MRLLIITNLFPWPGQPTRGMFNVQTARELARHHTVTVRVLVPEWRFWKWGGIRRWRSPAGGADTSYLPVFYLPGIGRTLSHLTYRWSLYKAAALFAKIKESDAVLVPWIYPDGTAVAAIARRLGRPVWLMALGSDTFHLDTGSRCAILKACDQAQGIVCVCRLLADRLAAAGVPPAKLHVVPNGVDPALFRYRSKVELPGCHVAKLLRGQENGRHGINNLTTEQLSNSQRILFVGNLVPVKGPDVMVRAFAAMDEKLSSCQVPQLLSESPEGSLPSATQQPSNSVTRLLIIGSGPMQAQLERLAKDLNIAERVHFLGNRPHDEVALWMNAADVLCLTSRNEGMPNVVLEALASGLPIVATDVGACREMLAEEPAARVCRPCDEAGLAIAMGELLGWQVDRKALSHRHIERYSWRHQAEAIAGLMDHE